MSIKEISFPFDSVEDENGIDDRVFYAENFAGYFSKFISNGVYPNPSNGLQIISSNNNFVLTVRSGSGFINGYGYILKEDLQISLNVANASYARKDIVVLKLNLVERNIIIKVKEGIASANPVLPVITRNSDTYELKLAEITVKSGTQGITQSDILDTRLDNTVCGVVTAVVDSVDTSKIFNQYDNYLNKKITEWNNIQTNQVKEFSDSMEQKDNIFKEKLIKIETWYTTVKLDITKLQTFDFDNVVGLKGTIKNTIFNTDGSINEVIKIKDTEIKVAEKLTSFLDNGGIVENMKIYEKDGISLLNEMTKTTVFNADGSITEEVV